LISMRRKRNSVVVMGSPLYPVYCPIDLKATAGAVFFINSPFSEYQEKS
jgi:hypothetical protein